MPPKYVQPLMSVIYILHGDFIVNHFLLSIF